ncbi:MAG: tyrosine-type recombinase/integrase [Candidatus Omnitrophica bacterium]|nr:tyrosine-type recombinase/integrase [Candidatus Omnitrophota bacterium]
MKDNIQNERIKRAFFHYLKEAKGRSDATINAIEQAILHYQDSRNNEDFALFNQKKAVAFKEWLKNRAFKGKSLSIVSHYNYLRHLRTFFDWLSREPGYKSKIAPASIDFLRPLEKEARIATQKQPRPFPTLEYVQKLTATIKPDTEIALRDRALIAFTLLSGMRDQAIASLPLGCINEETRTINQNPQKGVQTKFSKLINSTLFEFDPALVEYFLEWVKRLKKQEYTPTDPLFPQARTENSPDNLSFETATNVSRAFWKGAGPIRKIFNKRSDEAGLPYFPPHAFRHLAVDLALKACKNGEQIKAISQNFGHEYIATTMYSYANFNDDQLSQILKSIDFQKKNAPEHDKKLEQIRKILLDQ